MYAHDDDAYDLDRFNASRVEPYKPEFQMVPEAYSDDALTIDELGPMSGSRRAAPYLRKLDTVERRRRAVFEAHTLGNIRGGIYSANVCYAVRALLRLIEQGRESEKMYGEKFAYDAREAEKELRERTGNPNAIYYPKGLRQR